MKRLVAAVITFARAHVLALACVALVCLAAAGGVVGWRHYQYRQTADFAFQRLQQALQPLSVESLVRCVDFNGISRPLARAAARQYPFLKAGPQQEVLLNDMIQSALLRQARLKEESPKETPDAETRLKTELYALPPDFFLQFTAGLRLEPVSEDKAVVASSVRHYLFDKDFPVRLRMERGPDGWRIRGLEDPEGLAALFRAAQKERMAAQRQLLVDRNAASRKRMAATLPLESCTAQAGVLSDGKTALLVIGAQGRNKGQTSVNSLNLSVRLYDAQGALLLHRHLNAVDPVMPGQPMRHAWTLEMDAQEPVAQRLLAARTPRCEAEWQTLGLGSGEVLHLVEVGEPLEEFQ